MCSQDDVRARGHTDSRAVGFDAVLDLVVDGMQLRIVRYGFESRLALGELDMELTEIFVVLSTEIGAQSRADFAPTFLAKILAIKAIGKGGSEGVDSWVVLETPRCGVTPDAFSSNKVSEVPG